MKRSMVWMVAIGCWSCGPAAAPLLSPPVPVAASTPKRLEFGAAPRGGTGKAGPVLEAIGQELRRSQAELTKRGQPPPYFIAYQVSDKHEVDIRASHGALLSSDAERSRTLDVDVRVGGPKLDNTHAIDEGPMAFRDRMGRGAARLPIEDDADAIRAVVWRTTDERYKSAIERLVRIKANKSIQVAEEDQSRDFSQEVPANYLEHPAVLSVDVAAWEQRVVAYSKAFVDVPAVHSSKVRFTAEADTRSFVNSEGSRIQIARTHLRLSIQASTTAEDGMELSRFEAFDVSSSARLPSHEEVMERIKRVAGDLAALRQAPLADPYVGPAILQGEAAGVFFHEIFGHRVEGHRLKDADEGQTFTKKVGKPVMPAFIDVFDDPSVTSVNGIDLNGHYRFDDEGVIAQRASLVDDGIFKGFLMSRAPARGFPKSNGHGRRQPGKDVVARQSNLVVDPQVVTTPELLKQRLIEEVKKQNKPYGLRFVKVEGGFTMTGRFMPQAFKVRPVMVYRVYTDGREELIRGVDLEGTPLTSLSRILAAANDFSVFNGRCGAESGWVPVSATSPSLLVEQVEVARKEKGKRRPPILPAPPAEAGGAS
jgi:TldD protein